MISARSTLAAGQLGTHSCSVGRGAYTASCACVSETACDIECERMDKVRSDRALIDDQTLKTFKK